MRNLFLTFMIMVTFGFASTGEMAEISYEK